MSLAYRQEVTLGHQLALTPDVQQRIAILSMSALELNEFVGSLMEDNPFLTFAEKMPTADFEDDSTQTDAVVSAQSIDAASFESGGVEEGAIYYKSHTKLQDAILHQHPAKEETLEEHLLKQLNIQFASPLLRAAGEQIIGNVDGNGYLKISVSTVADCVGISQEQVMVVLKAIQRFDPVGCASRDLAECLYVQLEERAELSPLLCRILQDGYLTLFESTSIAGIASKLGVREKEIVDALELIRSCNPRPGTQFSKPARFICPEMEVQKNAWGEYTVVPGNWEWGHVAVSEHAGQCQSDEGSMPQHFKDMRSEALNVVRSLEYRKSTLFNLTRYISNQEQGFFDHGVSCLKPLRMEDAAEAIGVSKSTISRLANGNYMQTPVGLFELRFFFCDSLESKSGHSIASSSVEHRIRQLVAQEDADNPLSDQAIADALADTGIAISRRTVSKYRSRLGIPARSVRIRRLPSRKSRA